MLVRPPFTKDYVLPLIEQGLPIIVGNYTYGKPIIYYYGNTENTGLVIGKFCSIGNNVQFLLDGNHRLDFVSTYPFLLLFETQLPDYNYSNGVINIGNDIWFGHNSIIMSGVNIGDGAVIAAGSIVTKDIEPYAIVGGNPAKLIRKRFDDDTINALLEIQWWNWSLEEIQSISHLFQSPQLLIDYALHREIYVSFKEEGLID